MRYKIGSYARLSYDRNGEEIAVERQHEDNKATVGRHPDWGITKYYTDNDVSAFKRGVVRDDFEQMLTDLATGVIDGIAAYDLDRLWRQPIDLERVIELYEGEWRPFATGQGDYDLSTSDGRTMARVLVAMANKASEDTSRRVKRKIKQDAELGKPHWSKRPYGHNLDGTLDPVEAGIVRDMGEWLMQGYHYREIAWRLNEAGRLNRGNALWYSGKVRSLVASPRLASIRVHNDVEYQGTWTPIFTRQEWRDLRTAAKAHSENWKGTPNNRRYLLTGLLVCQCGTYLRGMTKRDGDKTKLRRTYQCPSSSEQYRRLDSCAGVCVGSEPLEHFIKEAILMRLDGSNLASYLADGTDDDRSASLLHERLKWNDRLNVLADDYADGTLTKNAYKRSVARLQGRLTTVDRELDSLRIERFKLDLNAGETVREAWETRPDGWRRQLAEVLIDHIDVNKSKLKPLYDVDGHRTRFDPSRVSITWRA